MSLEINSVQTYVKEAMKKPWVVATSIAFATILVYLPALQNGFVTWDDGAYVFENYWLRSLDSNLLRFAFGFDTPNWHPLTWVVHALDYALWGLNPVGHHATSILLHVLVTVLFFFVVLELLAIRGSVAHRQESWSNNSCFQLLVAGVAGLIFGVHPVHVESVAWASGKKDLLCTFFVLASVYAYAQYILRETANTGSGRGVIANPWYLASIAGFMLALLSKPSAVSFPLVLLLLDWYPFERVKSHPGKFRLLIEKAPFFILSLANAAITYYTHNLHGDVVSVERVGLAMRLLVSAKAAFFYLVHLLWPVELLPFYPYPKQADIFMPSYLLPLIALATISLGCVFLFHWKKQKLPALVWLYFMITLVPVIGLVKMGFQEMADRYSYLPSAGPILLFALLISVMIRRTGSANCSLASYSGITASFLVVLALSLLTLRQTLIWKNDFSLWNYEIQKAPNLSWISYQNRGTAHSTMGHFNAALDDYVQALAMNPGSPELYFNIANIYARMGRLVDAITEYTRAISLVQRPNIDYYHNRSVVYRALGRETEAVADLQEIERLKLLRTKK